MQETKEPIEQTVPSARPIVRIGLFILFLVFGLAVLLFGSNYYNRFPTSGNLIYSSCLCAAFLVSAILFKRSEKLARYWQIAYAFFVASAVNLVSTLFAGFQSRVLSFFGIFGETNQYMAFSKLYEAVLVIVPIILLTKIAGFDLGSLLIKKGNLKLGLGIGLLIFFNFVTSVLMFFSTSYSSPAKLGNALLWGFVFSICNSFLEELWFRALFMKKLQSLIGVAGTVILTSVWFALIHLLSGSTFMPAIAIPVFIVNTLTLGLACGYLMLKSDSIWGAIIIHAAADIFLFVSMLAVH
jgi:membrane protease YdiL (CAAX protease family)